MSDDATKNFNSLLSCRSEIDRCLAANLPLPAHPGRDLAAFRVFQAAYVEMIKEAETGGDVARLGELETFGRKNLLDEVI